MPPQNWNFKKPTKSCGGNSIKNQHTKFGGPSSIGSTSKIGGTKMRKVFPLSITLLEEIFLAPKWQISNSHNFGTISNFDMRFAASCSSCLGLSKQQLSTRLKAWKTFKIEAENDDFRKMLLQYIYSRVAVFPFQVRDRGKGRATTAIAVVRYLIKYVEKQA